MKVDAEIALVRFLRQLARGLGTAIDRDTVLRYVVRETRTYFGAQDAALVVCRAGQQPSVKLAIPDNAEWDARIIVDFLRGRPVHVPHDTLLGRLRWRGRAWAALCLRRREGEFEWDAVKSLIQVCDLTHDHLARIEQNRVIEARARIDRKIMEQLRPSDLFYQILDALRSVTDYDHSSALLIANGNGLELVAEQIAWRKSRSRRIGLKVPLSLESQALMARGGVLGFDRREAGWRAWPPSDSNGLAELLDFDRDGEPAGAAPRPASLLCAPLATRTGVIGVLRVAGLESDTFGEYERDVLAHFTAQASVAIQDISTRTESLHDRILEAEKKNAVANLARGVSHDVNNALGGVLPLVQQAREELESGRAEPQTLITDLKRIEESLQVCRRIFSGMLGFARSARQTVGQGNVRRAIDNTLAILRNSVERQGIELRIDVPDDLPLARTTQGNLEQLFLNLATNARDAMPAGGSLALRAAPRDASIEVIIEDTGAGIPPEIMARIEEPFFTTKSDGNGLGLSICRSLVWEMRGEMAISSPPGRGTCVRLVLPAGEGWHGEALG